MYSLDLPLRQIVYALYISESNKYRGKKKRLIMLYICTHLTVKFSM